MDCPWIVVSAVREGGIGEAIGAAELSTELDHVIVVASPETEGVIRADLAAPAVRVVVQPPGLGTAIELMHPLADVLERDPLGTVVFVPGDLHVAPTALREALGTASYMLAPGQITVVGAAPVRWCGEYTSFVAAGLVTTLWDEARAALPLHAALFERYIAAIGTPEEAPTLASAFECIHPASLGRDLLVGARSLAAVPLATQRLELRVLATSRPASKPRPSRVRAVSLSSAR